MAERLRPISTACGFDSLAQTQTQSRAILWVIVEMGEIEIRRHSLVAFDMHLNPVNVYPSHLGCVH